MRARRYIYCSVFCILILICNTGKRRQLATPQSPKQSHLTRQLLRFEPPDPRYDFESTQQHAVPKPESVMKILFYTVFLNQKHWFGLGREPFLGCKYSACETTSDKTQLSGAHAVLVNDVDIPRDFLDSLPKKRSPSQKWILSMSEPPVQTLMMYTPLNELFNATLNYKHSSDIYTPYLIITRRTSILPPLEKNFGKGRSKLVAWFASHCKTQSRREDYVNQLQKSIPVDIYGSCGPLTCPKDFKVINTRIKTSTYVPDSCDQHLNATYRFYLAFENSLCPEYVTEKVYRALTLDVVPIVLGGADYSKILPPRSYINVKDFSSPHHLAKYLQDLDADDDLYNEYFEWKRYFRVPLFSRACSLCHYLHANVGHRSVVRDIDKQWSYTECHTPDNYYKGVI